MATYFRLCDVSRQFFDSNGDPLSGGKLYTYESGTTTNKATYQDDAGGSSHANPIVLDSAGRIPAEVWGTTGAYKLRLDTSADATIWTADDIVGINDSASSEASEWVSSGLTPTYVGATQFTFAGDQTTTYHVGRRLKITDGGGTIYGRISASSYGAPNTTITIVTDSGTLTNPVTAVQYGLVAFASTSSPAIRYASGSYTGDGEVSKAITGVGFKPRRVDITQRRTVDGGTVVQVYTTDVIFDDNVSGGAIFIDTAGSSTFETGRITALGSDGFTVGDDGADAHPNSSGVDYNWCAWG